MLDLFRKAGMPRRAPPPLPGCARDDRLEPPRIASPLRNVTYALRGSADDTIPLDASVAADVQQVYWFDGRALIATRAVGDGTFRWRPATSGVHLIRVIDDHGRSAARDVEVAFAR
jgi:penicillin-binding protein 1C